MTKKKPLSKKSALPLSSPSKRLAKPLKKLATKSVVKKNKPEATKPSAKKTSLPKKPLKSSKVSAQPKTAALKKTVVQTVKPTAQPKKIATAKTSAASTQNKSAKTPEIYSSRQQFFAAAPKGKKDKEVSPFLTKQRARLLTLKDTLLDSIKGVSHDNLHAGSDTSGLGMHQADAGSDSYDRDFALSILSQEQNSLYEIDAALKRINDGTYGICEISNKPIPRARLEARPFTRYTVECQADLEKRQHVVGARVAVSSLFGITEDEAENEDDESLTENSKD